MMTLSIFRFAFAQIRPLMALDWRGVGSALAAGLLLMALSAQAQDTPSQEACPAVPPRPSAAADSVAWSTHAETIRARRTCETLREPVGPLFVDETFALSRADRIRDASRLIRTMMTTDAPVDSVSISQAMEIGAVAASKESMEGTGNHLFRTSERYLSSRLPEEQAAFYQAWATATMRFSRYETAVALLDSVRTYAPASPRGNAIQSTVHSNRVWAQFVAALLERPVSINSEADMQAAVGLATTDAPVWTSIDGSTHDARSRSQLARSIRLIQTNRASDALPIILDARARADDVGDPWAHQMSIYLEAVVQRNQERLDAAYATLKTLRSLPTGTREIAFQSLAILDQLQVAAERDNADRAGEALRALSTVPNVSPALFARASSIHSATFDRSTWTSTETWGRILILTLIFTALLQFAYWTYQRNGRGEDSAANDSPPDTANADGAGSSSSGEPDEAYRIPRGLKDPVVNDHATVAFDVQIDLDAQEIEEIIRATPFSGGYSPESAPEDASDNASADNGADDGADDADLSAPPTWNVPRDLLGDDAAEGNAEEDAAESDSGTFESDRPRVPGTPIRSEGPDRDAGAGERRPPRHVRVPCYGPDGSERGAVEIPARIAGGLIKRKIIALEAEGEVLLLYRFETGTDRVVHYDPESGTFSEVADETFHAFPIARVQSPD
jgi:hypothetical protein